jgi:hypothetical protein
MCTRLGVHLEEQADFERLGVHLEEQADFERLRFPQLLAIRLPDQRGGQSLEESATAAGVASDAGTTAIPYRI